MTRAGIGHEGLALDRNSKTRAGDTIGASCSSAVTYRAQEREATGQAAEGRQKRKLGERHDH